MDSRQLKLILSLQDNASKELRRVSGELDKNQKLTMAWDSALRTMKRTLIAVGAAAVAGLGWGVKIAADLQTAEIGLTTLLGSAEEAQATVARLKIEAARTPFELPGLTKATQLLTAVTKDGDKSIDILLDVGEGLAAMGKGQAELDRIIVNLQQIGAVGKASMIDVKQFAFAGIPIYEMLTDVTGKSGDALSDLISSGGVTFDLVTKMFDEANDAGGKFFNAFKNQGGSFNQVLSNMKDSLGIFLADIAESSGLMDGLTKAMATVSVVMGDWRGSLEQATNWIKEHGLVLSMIAGALTAVLIPALIAATISFGTLAIAAIAAFGAMLIAAAPFLIVGALIAGAAYLIINNWGAIKGFFVNLWETVTASTQAAFETMVSFFEDIWITIKDIFLTGINFIIGAYATLFDFMFPGWQGALNSMWEVLVLVFTAIKDFIGSSLAFIGETLGKWLEVVKTVWLAAWTVVKDVFGTLWESITAIFTTAKDAILDIMDAMIAPIQKVIDLARRALELGGRAIGSVKDAIKGGIEDIIDRGSEITGKANGGAVGALTPYIVGERGPELFTPGVSGMITPNEELGMNGGGVNINIYGDVTGEEIVEKVKRAMANDIKNRVRV